MPRPAPPEPRGIGRHGLPTMASVAILAGVALISLTRPASAWQPPRPAQAGAGAVRLPQPPATGLPETPEATLGYALGLQIGSRMREDFNRPDSGVDLAAFVEGLGDAILSRPPRIGEEKAMAALTAFEAKLMRQREEFQRRMTEAAKANAAKGADYLRANAAKKGVVSLPSGLQYEVLAEGRGPKPTADDTVSVQYRGTHVNGEAFDGTEPAGPPATFPVKAVVPGWQEALPLMKVGSKWRITIPPALAYGEEGSPPAIEPNEVLVFEIELVRIEPAARP